MHLFGNSRELQYKTCKSRGKTINKSKEQRRRIIFYEKGGKWEGLL